MFSLNLSEFVINYYTFVVSNLSLNSSFVVKG